MSRFQVLGVNDDRDFCECCGKRNLKKVVWIQDNESGDIKHFGTTCALSPVKGFGVDAEIKKAIKKHSEQMVAAGTQAAFAYRRAGGKYSGNAMTGWKVTDRDLYDKCLQEAKQEVFNRHERTGAAQ